jgi:pyruvate dehydrogenase phosphatase
MNFNNFLKFKLINKKTLKRLAFVSLFGLSAVSYSKRISFTSFLQNNTLSCFSTTQNEITTCFYPANNPIEDRYQVKYLKNVKALFLSVLDGHGGYTLSDFAVERLSKYFDDSIVSFLKSSDNEQQAVSKCLTSTFEKVENEFKEYAWKLYSNGEGRVATVGSCAMVAVIYNDYLYIANLGDSKARLIRYDSKYKEYYSEKLMHRHNSEKPREKEKLQKMFPNEKDIVICKRPNGTVCYVKGRLQPTRSLGDFHLKFPEFNQNVGSNYKRPVSNFTGPYISAVPEITVYPIDYEVDKFLIMATDGLCDFVTSSEVVNIVSSKLKSDSIPTANDFLDKVLENAAKESGITKPQLLNLNLGKRRNYHDDTTIIFLPLKK